MNRYHIAFIEAAWESDESSISIDNFEAVNRYFDENPYYSILSKAEYFRKSSIQQLGQILSDEKFNIVSISSDCSISGNLIFHNSQDPTHPEWFRMQPDELEFTFKCFSNRVDCVIVIAPVVKTAVKAIAKHIPYVIGLPYGQSDGSNDKLFHQVFNETFYECLFKTHCLETSYIISKTRAENNVNGRIAPILRINKKYRNMQSVTENTNNQQNKIIQLTKELNKIVNEENEIRKKINEYEKISDIADFLINQKNEIIETIVSAVIPERDSNEKQEFRYQLDDCIEIIEGCIVGNSKRLVRNEFLEEMFDTSPLGNLNNYYLSIAMDTLETILDNGPFNDNAKSKALINISKLKDFFEERI